MLKKNDILQVNIESVSGDGNGVAHVDGQVVFVPFTAVDDIAEITIIKVTKNYAVGKVRKILSPSKTRSNADCPVFGKCGGCVFRHLNLSEEERIKTETVRSAMRRIGHLDVEVKDCLTPSAFGYRNKAQLPVTQDENGIRCGFYASHSHRIVDGTIDCVTTPKIFGDIAKHIIDFAKKECISGYDETTGKGTIRHLYFRINSDDRVMVCIVTSTKKLASEKTEKEMVNRLVEKFSEISSIYLNHNPADTNVVLGKDYRLLWGEEYFTDTLLDTKLKMSPDSFFQVNRAGAEKIYSIGFSLLKGHYENVYDLYCGIGSIGITLFNQMKKGNIKASANRLFGIEIVDKAADCAKENAKINGIENAEFAACDSADITSMDWFDRYPPSLVILDPPRKGTTTKLLDFLSDRNVGQILYISCDPATLARDMGYLVSKGYESTPVYPVNLFTGTKHVESVVCLSRKTTHEMKLCASPFEKIKSGAKNIELRLFDEKRQKIKTGDDVIFTNSVNGEKMRTTVKKLHRFDSFEELYKNLPLLQCGYTLEDIDTAHPSDMEQYYSAEEQKKYGVVGIELFPPKLITD